MGGNNKQSQQRNNATTQRTRKEFRQLRQRHQQLQLLDGEDDDEQQELRPGGGGGDPQIRSSRAKHRPVQVLDEHGMPYETTGNASNAAGSSSVSSSSSSSPWIPTDYTAFKLLLSARLSAAFWSIISDCDETYNYWEPMHFLMYGKGFQTWEYSPQFALRSYLYVMIHTVPGWLYDAILKPNPMYVFYFTRCLLALASALAELYFFKGVTKEVGANVGRLTLALMVFSAGLFVSSTAFLPSTTSMYLTLLSHGAWFHQSYALAIFFTALSAFLSWPFAALLGGPIAIDLLLRKRKYGLFIKWSLISAVTILLPQTAVDSDFYGKFVSAPLNIVKYNVFTSHGPDLYGTEPWHFYPLNGILNFNLAFPAALLVLPAHALVRYLVGGAPASRHFLPYWLAHMALYLWLLVFGLQPHKEERFLFPVYPLICLAAAASIDCAQKLVYYFWVDLKYRHYLHHTQWLSVSAVTVYAILCFSRITALYQNYHAPIDVWMHVAHMNTDNFRQTAKSVNVCVGKEWHRFPNSFFLPDENWNLRFVKSEFRGQLPQPYASGAADADGLDDDSKSATRLVRNNFNDQNREEPVNRYVADPNAQCDLLVDLEVGSSSRETDLEPTYSKNSAQWKEEFSVEFLDAANSHRLFRAFYLPFVSQYKCNFTKYVLLKNINKKAAAAKHMNMPSSPKTSTKRRQSTSI